MAVRDVLLQLRKAALERQLEDLQRRMRDQNAASDETLVAESWQLRMVANQLQQAVQGREWEKAAPILKIYE